MTNVIQTGDEEPDPIDSVVEEFLTEQFFGRLGRAGCRCAIPNCTACPMKGVQFGDGNVQFNTFT